MNKRSLYIALAGLFLTSGVFLSHSALAGNCFGAEITRVGATGANEATGNTGYRIEVSGGTCGFAANTPFFLADEAGQAGLAVALTAFAIGKTVTLVSAGDGPPPANSLIFKIHVDG
jgi:hypothetical protein